MAAGCFIFRCDMLTKTVKGTYKCAICHTEYSNVRQLSLNISCGHKMTTQEYYDRFCKEPGEGECKVCGKPTKFRSLGEGYKETCSHKCGSILLKNDPAKMAAKKAKTEATCMAKYGVSNGGGSQAALEKAQKTNMERRGVRWNMQSKKVVEKSKSTCMEKYGTTTFVHSEEGAAKVIATVRERFGRDNFFSGQEGNEAAKAGMLAKHGANNPMRVPEILSAHMAADKENNGGKFFVQTDKFKKKSKETQFSMYGTWYSASPEGRAKYREIMLDKVGVPEYFQSDEFKEKSKETMLATRGVENISQTAEWKDKVAATSIEKYGVQHFTQSAEVKSKAVSTNMDRYGVKNFAQTLAWFDKFTETSMERWGVPHPAQSKEVQEKKDATMMERYGVKHYLQSDAYRDSILDRYIKLLENYQCSLIERPTRESVTYRCERCGNESTEQIQLVKDRVLHGVTPCTHCHPKNAPVSLEENEVKAYVESLGMKVDHYDRDFLGVYGADIVVESAKTIIEYDGIYWHSELYKDSRYHLEKKLRAQDKGYRLVHIFSDEWVYNRPIVESRLRYLFGCAGMERVNTRDCQVREVSAPVYRDFLNQHHLQGAVNSKWAYGLFHSDKLVSLMTFGMSRFEDDTVELLRFCSDRDCVIPGAAGKLFKHFVDSHPEIAGMVSYADMRWSTGDAFYTKLGFELESMSEPGYFIVDGDMRRNRMNYQKHKIAGPGDEGKTEHEITLERGLYRIYDCGQLKYRWHRP